MQFATDEKIGKYRIIGELGRGGMGVVYLAEDTNLERQVALKFLQPSLSEDTSFRERFRSEARLISRIVHPNIVQIHSLDDADGLLLIDMEYVEGQSLGHLMGGGPLSTSLASHIALDVLQGLSVCHESGILHRDIKPSNVLLSIGGKGKIADFGIATALADRTAEALSNVESTMVFMGTPRYTPPEAFDEHPADARWDVYALGVMLHEALTGEVAYQSRTMYSLINEIVNTPLPPIEKRIEGISPQFAEVLNAMVDPVPSARIESANEAMKHIRETQEAKSYSPYDAHTITRTLPRPIPKRRKSGNTIRRSFGRVAAALTIGTAALAGVYAAYPLFGTPQSVPPIADSTGSGQSGIGAPISEAAIWTAKAIGDSGVADWTMYLERRDDGIESFFGYNDLGLIHINLNELGDRQFEIDGSWAEFRDPHGVSFQSGTVSGSGMQHGADGGFTLTAVFRSDRDRTRREETFYVSPSVELQDLKSFVRTIEASPWLPTLLDHEIRPRRLPLGAEVDSLLPSNPTQKVVVPVIDAATLPAIDGELNEDVWKQRFFNNDGRIGELEPAAGRYSTPLQARHDGEAVYIGMTIPVLDVDEAEVRIALRQIVERPLQNSPWTLVEIDMNGDYDIRQYASGREVPLPAEWTVAGHRESDSWTLELRVPLDEEFITMGATGIRNALRFVCETNVDGETGLYWGASTIDDVHHGAILIIESTNN